MKTKTIKQLARSLDFTTDSDLSDCTSNDISDFLKRGYYWRK